MDSESKNSSFSDENQVLTGLRSKRLFAMIVCLVILFFLTLILLFLNILIISTLRMNPSGIQFLKFHQTMNKQSGKMEKTVEMAGDKIEFDKVESNKIVGFPGKEITIQAPRVLISANENDSSLQMNQKFCRLENINNFQVSSLNGRTLFSARHPTISIDKRIKKISAEKIITNKIRSPVDDELKIDANNIILRGNEYVRIDARNIQFEAMNRISFNISRDGVVHFRGKIRLGDGSKSLPISTSPSLSASQDGLRLCACLNSNHKLFTVAANKNCYAQHTFCI